MQVDDQDIKRKLRRPAQRPAEFYQKLNHFGITFSGLKPVRIYDGRLAVTSFSVVAALTNSVTCFFGTDIVSVDNGWPLDPGKVVFFEVTPEQQVESALIPYGHDRRLRRVYINLGDFWVVTTANNQSVRIFYSIPTEIPL